MKSPILSIENIVNERKKRNKLNEKLPQIVFELDFDTNNNGKEYPCFNYKQLLKEHSYDSSSGEDERFHDRESEQLVRRLQQKYANVRDKKGRKVEIGTADDYMDKGAGYDLDDSFVDDTEAYDELIPSTIDTARRGFYVNTGVLEFRSIASDDDDDTNGKRVPSTSKKLKPTLAKKKMLTKISTADASISALATPDISVVDEMHNDTAPCKGNESIKRAANIIKNKRLIGMPPTLAAAKSIAKSRKRPTKQMIDAESASCNNDDEELRQLTSQRQQNNSNSIDSAGLTSTLSSQQHRQPTSSSTHNRRMLDALIEHMIASNVMSTEQVAELKSQITNGQLNVDKALSYCQNRMHSSWSH